MMSQDPKERTLLMGLGVKISKKVNKLFKELEPDRQEIQQALRELKKIVHPPRDDMEPPRAAFIDMVDACQASVDELESGPEKNANKQPD